MVHVIRFGLVGGLLLLMIFAQRSTGTWANPISFYAAPFTLIALAQEVFLPGVPFSALMALLILGSATALWLGMLVTWRRPAQMTDPGRLPDARQVPRTIGLCASFAVALLYLYELNAARATGLGTTASGVFDRAEFFAQGGQTPLLQALQALTYCGVLYVAFEARQRKRPALVVGAYLLIVFAQSLVMSTKLPVLLSMLLVIGVAAAGYPTRFRTIDRRVLAGVTVFVVVLLATFGLVTVARSKGTADVFASTSYALLASPSAYSLVLDDEAVVHVDARWGLSVAGIRDRVAGHGDTRQLGAYADIVQFDQHAPESATNIYTWFLPLRHDFGLPGTFVVIFGLGLIAGVLTTRQLAGVLAACGQTALAVLNLALAYAPFITLTYYNLSWLLLAMGVPLAWLYANGSRRVASRPTSTGSRDGRLGARFGSWLSIHERAPGRR